MDALTYARQLERDADWLRTSWLAVAVRGTIWGKEDCDAYSLLGWDRPPTMEEEQDARETEAFNRMWADQYHRQHGVWPPGYGPERKH